MWLHADECRLLLSESTRLICKFGGDYDCEFRLASTLDKDLSHLPAT